MADGDDNDQQASDRLRPQSMHPLDPEEALRGFMQVNPERVKERLQVGDGDSEDDG